MKCAGAEAAEAAAPKRPKPRARTKWRGVNACGPESGRAKNNGVHICSYASALPEMLVCSYRVGNGFVVDLSFQEAQLDAVLHKAWFATKAETSDFVGKRLPSSVKKIEAWTELVMLRSEAGCKVAGLACQVCIADKSSGC